MSRRDRLLLDDIRQAIAAIERHRLRGPLHDELVLDAIRMRLIEIGEAVKELGDDVKGSAPAIPWRQIAGMRDRLAHRYFETEIDIIHTTIERDMTALAEVVEQLVASLDDTHR